MQTIKESLMLERLLNMNMFSKGLLQSFKLVRTIMREMLTLLLRHLFIIFNRKITTEHVIRNEFLDSQMDNAITYFNTNYNCSINVEEYASSIGMSISWFIRSFKKYTCSTPIQFITSLRMTNAQVLA